MPAYNSICHNTTQAAFNAFAAQYPRTENGALIDVIGYTLGTGTADVTMQATTQAAVQTYTTTAHFTPCSPTDYYADFALFFGFGLTVIVGFSLIAEPMRLILEGIRRW